MEYSIRTRFVANPNANQTGAPSPSGCNLTSLSGENSHPPKFFPLVLVLGICLLVSPNASFAQSGIPSVTLPVKPGVWLSSAEIAALPASGAAWDAIVSEASQICGTPNLEDQEDMANVCVLAKALVFARTGQTSYRSSVASALDSIVNMGTYNGRALALGRELGTYAVAADLIDLKNYNPSLDSAFRAKLRELRTTYTNSGPSDLIDCHEDRPNNWGTHCGASRVAVARYLGDTADLQRAAQVFKGYLGDRSSYAGFRYGETSWQCSPGSPVGINPAGCTKSGHNIDGVLPDDQRRAGTFTWPPPKENYVWEGLQGALMQAVILHRAGYDVFNWEDKALYRALVWLHGQANFPAAGDDTWSPHIVNYFYAAAGFPAPIPTRPGKNMGYTDWTNKGKLSTAPPPVLTLSTSSLAFSATAGGANPASQALTLSNTGGGMINWTASSSHSWLSVSPLTGGNSATLTATINAAGLSAGTYTGTITVNAGSITGSPASVGVTLTLAAAPMSIASLTVAPNPVTGGQGSTGTVTLANTAPSGGAVVALSDNSSMSAEPASVTVPAGARSANFAITTSTVLTRQQSTITASLNGSMQAVLVIDPVAAPTACLTSSTGTWRFQSFPAQVGNFTAEFDATPAATNLDSVIGLADSTVGSYSSLATTVRFNSMGRIDARNGDVYSAASTISYSTGKSYHFRLVVRMGTHRYDAYVRPAGGSEVLIGSNLAFRTQQATVANLNTLASLAATSNHSVCNLQVAATTTTAACTTSSSSAWSNTAFASQSSNFTAQFDAIPGATNMDGVTGISPGPASGFTGLAAIVRFNPSGAIDARNGSAYAAATTLAYSPGASYHFRLVVRPSTKRYDVYVTPPGGSERSLGSNFAFRTEQSSASSLANAGSFASTGSHQTCNLRIN